MLRSFDYARTAPEPPEGALVFAVVLVEIVMARTYGRLVPPSTGFGLKIGPKRVERGSFVTP
jgi:hypothetical protein